MNRSIHEDRSRNRHRRACGNHRQRPGEDRSDRHPARGDRKRRRQRKPRQAQVPAGCEDRRRARDPGAGGRPARAAFRNSSSPSPPTSSSPCRRSSRTRASSCGGFQDDAQRELDDARRVALEGLEERILPVIDAVGKEQGMTLIFNKFQSGLVYADETVDITDEVIRRFNTAP